MCVIIIILHSGYYSIITSDVVAGNKAPIYDEVKLSSSERMQREMKVHECPEDVELQTNIAYGDLRKVVT